MGYGKRRKIKYEKTYVILFDNIILPNVITTSTKHKVMKENKKNVKCFPKYYADFIKKRLYNNL